MFIEPTITWVLRGSLGTYGLTKKLCKKRFVVTGRRTNTWKFVGRYSSRRHTTASSRVIAQGFSVEVKQRRARLVSRWVTDRGL